MELIHPPGEIIGDRYRILEILGQGGVGITYAAEDLGNKQIVAFKVLSLEHLSNWKTMELFEREAQILEQLQHPSIPRYLEYFHTESSFYIVQELAQGESLAKLVENGWRANEKEIKRIGIQILKILSYLHSLEPPVIHRDIKPHNIIRRDDGQIFLVDFGAVKNTYHSTLMRGSTVVGTFGYMALEQFRGQAVPATDLYALGATLLFLLTHRSPAELPTDRLKINFRSHVQISEDFADFLEKMLEPDLEDRFSSAKEALAALSGKGRIRERVNHSLSWQTLVGTGLIATAAVMFLNFNRWKILTYLGFLPDGMCNNPNIVKSYIEHGGNPNVAIEGDIWTLEPEPYASKSLLECVSAQGNKEVLKLLIVKGANVRTKFSNGETLLQQALEKGDEELVKILIANGAGLNSREAIELLIDKNVDPYFQHNHDKTLYKNQK